jgi:DNA-binding transcriptional MerR regulator
MYRIGQFSKLGKITIKTLRHYDEVGLLTPASVDEWTGYRYYTTEQLFDLQEIVALRQMGFSIAEVHALVGDQDAGGLLQRKLEELQADARAAADKLSRLHTYLAHKQRGTKKDYKIALKERPGCIVFSRRRTLASDDELYELIPATGEEVARANPGLKCAEPDYCFTIYHDGIYKEHDVDIEICQAVVAMGEPVGDITFKELPAITAATTLHKGHYSTLRNAYAALMQWIEANGYSVAGDFRESYIDGVWNKESESDWLTEVQVPVSK